MRSGILRTHRKLNAGESAFPDEQAAYENRENPDNETIVADNLHLNLSEENTEIES
jgi:hypothetical protein